MKSLSPQEQHLFNCLKDYLDTHHYSPSIKELQTAIDERSRSHVQELLGSLKSKGYITWNPEQRRTYQVLLLRGVPVLGMIQAGLVVEHPADLVEWAEISGVSCGVGLYGLRVCGDSMIDAYICDGDLVLLRAKPDLWSMRQDAIAAVWVEGEGATLKMVSYDGQSVWLKPANSNYPSRQMKPEQIELQGMVISSHRYYNTRATD
jgi:repressor LexA